MAFSSLILSFLLAQAGSDASAIRVLGADFFASDSEHPGSAPVSTRQIAHRPGSSCYEWVVRVMPVARSVTVREVFRLPSAAPQWGVDPARTQVSDDGRESVTEIAEDLSDGMISNGWCVAEGDPVGRYRISVFDGDRLIQRFDFEVQLETY
ncbi:hypothetical protein [Allosphingosinicella deserti]|uniref:Uncharacterized protein n=1 Tax=Allosphingosinicella deserti TaxID=2116704 RepID=A0A2P7QRQ1_9SPHN|nr:hypothetical protein [Sphingomonas deserti]PSJ40610.1 hypothetical protein C7I55_09810 [Sphingomonas deserti]